MTENGPDTLDEINLVEPGFNSGWNRVRGPIARTGLGVGDLFRLPGSHYTDPKFSWFLPVAPTGLAFLASPSLGTQYESNLFVGDFNTGTLYRFRLNAARDGFVLNSPPLADLVADSPGELGEVTFGIHFGGVTDLKVGPDGRLYVLSLPQGVIHVISRPTTPPPTPLVANAGSSTADSVGFGSTVMGSVMSPLASASPLRPEGPVAALPEADSGPSIATTAAQTPTVVEDRTTRRSEIAVTKVRPEPRLRSVLRPSLMEFGESVDTVTATPSVAADESVVATDWPAGSPNAAAARTWRAPLRAANGLGLTILAVAGLYVLGRRARPLGRRASAAAATAKSRR